MFKPWGAKSYAFLTRDPALDKKYTILEGSVRSSKTWAIDAKLIFKLITYPVEGKRVICGATKQTVYKNILLDLQAIVGKENFSYNSATGELWLFGQQWFVIGAKDEASFKSILGMTIGIAICDEFTTFPRSFTMQLFLRLSPDGARLYATTNPDSPYHYLKTDVIDNSNYAPDLEVIHFTLNDNPNISPESRKQIESSQTGMFYLRYIKGLWVIAEGAIYRDSWSDSLLYDSEADEPPGLRARGGYAKRLIGVDYGTANPMVFLDIYDDGKIWWVRREYYWDSVRMMKQKTDAEYADDLQAFIGDERNACVVIDPSAASFKVEMVKRNIWHMDANNDVAEGIRKVAMVLHQRLVKINRTTCPKLVAQMQSYAWNEKKAKHGEEEPIKEEDHAPDAFRYPVNTCFETWRMLAA